MARTRGMGFCSSNIYRPSTENIGATSALYAKHKAWNMHGMPLVHGIACVFAHSPLAVNTGRAKHVRCDKTGRENKKKRKTTAPCAMLLTPDLRAKRGEHFRRNVEA